MPLICKSCPNKTHFKRVAYGSANWSTVQDIDENEEVIDDSGYDYEDYDTTDTGTIECSNCNGDDIDDVSQEEWNNWEGPESHEEDSTWKNKLLRNK